jgi:hypothetical protein
MDFLYLALVAALFAVAAGLARGCNALRGGQS